MKILDVRALPVPEVKVVRFGRFRDDRGYFTEPYRRSNVDGDEATSFLKGLSFPQVNESQSRAGVIRGLHFQWNPFMGKLVRTITGRMVDLALDIRLESPSFGQIVAHDMPWSPVGDSSEWIWVPPGFAHGNYFTEDTVIEYFCTGEYSPGNEAGVSPLAPDIDWSLAPPELVGEFRSLVEQGPVMSAKDRDAPSVSEWESDSRATNFRYAELARSAS